ncbi:hypothetical protein CAI21_01550 [Alkalilimnicola ehrlichii]|uniref:Phage holin n=1 Tax=Alkalilimnicola ehrlichii TaxID=351052 RepID=A0A3E0X4C1_9GAMM|nr:putative holin [Alkalilimnicola ehrlichii]RFA31340.1 hypothetical protein CAI21_01550 [Alkalilimnicola ehrlichii]RFA39386.1 hypothetical protein CAL65_00860 [Alkalilimnicola ehrlichii]
MAEPSTTAIASTTAGAITVASLLPGIDAGTLIGACAGATLFVMSAKDLGIATRLLYLAISLSMGYVGGPAVLGHIFDEPAISAFVFSAGVVGLGNKIIAGIDQIDINRWFRPKN